MSDQEFGRLEGPLLDATTRQQRNKMMTMCLLFVILLAASLAAGYSISTNAIVKGMYMAPLSAGLVAKSTAMDTASSALMANVRTNACDNVSVCPPGDLACDLCKCHELSAAELGASVSCTAVTCACESILDASGNCASGTDVAQCAICQLVPAGACSE